MKIKYAPEKYFTHEFFPISIKLFLMMKTAPCKERFQGLIEKERDQSLCHQDPGIFAIH